MSERAHLDLSILSRLESGKRRLALDQLPILAEALGVSADELLGNAAPPDPRVRNEPVKRDGLTMWPLTNRGQPGGVRTFKIRIGARRRNPPATLRVHDGHDWMYILNGRMRLVLGEQDLVIKPGEAIEFSTLTPHWFGAVGGPPTSGWKDTVNVPANTTVPIRIPFSDIVGRTVYIAILDHEDLGMLGVIDVTT